MCALLDLLQFQSPTEKGNVWQGIPDMNEIRGR